MALNKSITTKALAKKLGTPLKNFITNQSSIIKNWSRITKARITVNITIRNMKTDKETLSTYK
jgi:hypothetical protein